MNTESIELAQPPGPAGSCSFGARVRKSHDYDTLLIEVGVEDAHREPKIAEKGVPICASPEQTASGRKELIGNLLKSAANGYAYTFLDLTTNLCGIYATRPLICRLFDCDHEGRDQLIELGILEREA